MTWELAAGFPRDLTQSKKFRAWAETSSPTSPLGRHVFELRLQRRRMRLDAPVVARLDPAFVADKPHGARAQRLDPSRPLAEGRLQAVEHQLHAVGVAGVDRFPRRFVLDRSGVVGPIGPLAEIDGVRSPVEQLRSRSRNPSIRAILLRRSDGCKDAKGPVLATGPNRQRRAAGWARREARS